MPRRRKVYDDQASTMTVSVCADGPFNNPLDVKPTLNRFADDTSMLGFRYLHSRYKTWFRVLWAFVLVFFIGLTIYQVFERIGYYFIRNPLVTVRTYDSPTSIEFPTVVICNKMQLKASKIATIRPDLLKTMSLIYEDNQTPTKNPQIRDSLHEFDRVNLLNVYKQARQSDDDLFLSCQYKGRQCLDVIRPIITPNGLCYAVSLNETVQRPGPESTLSLLLNLEVYEAIPGWVTEQGIVISMFDSTVPETAHFIEGMHLEPGKLVTIPINDIRRLKRHSSGCGRSNCGGMFRPAEYSRAACHWTVKQDDIQKKCHCNALNSPLYRKMSFHSEIGAGSSSENGTVDNRTTRKPHRKSLIPVCTLKQELECVHRIKNEPLSGRALQQLQNCPQDCTDVSLTTIVFGNELDVNEISRFLPGDWEEEKEKRLKQFQIALDILPKYRIPVVQNIQKLADEAQQFLSDALELFEISNITNETHVPCTMEGEVGVFVRQMSRFHTEERLWRHVTNYAQLVLPHQLESLFKAIGIYLDRDHTFTIHKRDIDREVDAESYQSQVDNALFDLQLIEVSMNRPKDVFGLKDLSSHESSKIIAQVVKFVHSIHSCLQEFRQNNMSVNLHREQCYHIFLTQYQLFEDAKMVDHILNSNIIHDYETTVRKLTAILRRTRYEQVPRIFDYTHHNISLREFEAFYRDGGKDNQALHEILKCRKTVQTDVIEAINDLTHKINNALTARIAFYKAIGISPPANEAIAQTHQIVGCLQRLVPKIHVLKKATFLKAEWMSRLQREVTIAQSYSPGPQYDKVNLLFLKIYFAHFKQELIVQERSYNLFLLLAEIGGTIGLYVGATLLTVAETVVFFFEKNTRNFNSYIVNHHVDV